MIRAVLEYRPTLDDLFGHNIEAETEDVRREVDALIEAERKAVRREFKTVECYLSESLSRGKPPPPSLRELRTYFEAMARYRRLAQLESERHKFSREGFWHTSFAVGIKDFLAIGADGKLEVVPFDEEREPTIQRDPSIKVYLFPSLGYRLLAVRWSLKDSIHQGEESVRRALDALRRMVERFAAVARIAVDRCLSAIEEAKATLRRRALIAAQTASPAPTPRELIGELLSPHVLAAGGGFGLFVIRC